MGLFKKIFKGVKQASRFAKKTVGKVAKPALSIAATAFGGPVGGVLVNKAIGLLGEGKVGKMAAKVISDGVVKVDKVEQTLKSAGVATTNTQTVVDALKNAAAGISGKAVGVAGFTGGVTASGNAPVVSISFKDRVVGWWNSAKNWAMQNKKLLFIALGVVAVICVYYFGFGKRKKWRV